MNFVCTPGLVILACACVASVCLAQVDENTPGWFPFTIPGLESSVTPIDLSHLNEDEAGQSGRVIAKSGHFLDGSGKRIRFFGVNIGAGACFPEKETGRKVAARLAKMGVNVVRLHHMDYSWSPGSLTDAPDSGMLNSARLDRLDAFVAELKKNGIYININLHVSRRYAGFTETLGEDFTFGKAIDNFYRPFIDSQKQYAKELLTHVNPYTGKSYAADPAVAFVEVNNENALTGVAPAIIARLPSPYSDELAKRWRNWLSKKYTFDQDLREAWKQPTQQEQKGELLSNPAFSDNAAGWHLEKHGGSDSSLTPLAGGKGVRWMSTKAGSESWHMQLNLPGVTIYKGNAYRVSVRARADNPGARLFVTVNRSSDPYTELGFSETLSLTSDFKDYMFEFVGSEDAVNGARLNFSLLNKVTAVEMERVSLAQVSPLGLPAGEILRSDRVPLPTSASARIAWDDFRRFLVQIEYEYALEMRDYIKKELNCGALITQTQSAYGGPVGIRRESRLSDFTDQHGYWQHPNFPAESWSGTNWTIGNTSLFTSPDGGTITDIAVQRAENKPYTISEYDIAAPNDHSAETLPSLASYACLQDWDGLYQFVYAGSEAQYGSDRIASFFDLAGHTGKLTMTPWAALVYRQGMIKPAESVYTLMIPDKHAFAADTRNYHGGTSRLWSSVGVSQALGLVSRVAVRSAPIDAPVSVKPSPPTLKAPFVSDTKELTWNPERAELTVNAPKAKLWIGRAAGRTMKLGEITVTAGAAPETMAFSVVALDDRPTAESKKLLVTALSRVENQGMGWNAERTSVSNQWGKGPTVVLGVNATIEFAPGLWKAWALDGTGAPATPVRMSGSALNIGPGAKSVWFLLTR